MERMTTFATRTLTLCPIDEKKAGKMENLLDMLEKLRLNLMIEGARSIGSAFFELTMTSIHALKEVERRFHYCEEPLYKVVPRLEEEP